MKQIYFSFKLLIFSSSFAEKFKCGQPMLWILNDFFLPSRENVWDGVFYLQPPESHFWFASSMKFIPFVILVFMRGVSS